MDRVTTVKNNRTMGKHQECRKRKDSPGLLKEY